MNLAPNFTESNRPPLRAEVDADQKLILIVDGRGELLALTIKEAADLVDELSGVLDIVGWER